MAPRSHSESGVAVSGHASAQQTTPGKKEYTAKNPSESRGSVCGRTHQNVAGGEYGAGCVDGASEAKYRSGDSSAEVSGEERVTFLTKG